MTVPRIGALRRRLAIERARDVADGAGGVTRSFTREASVWGRIEPRRARESVEAGRPVGRVTHHVTIRWRGDVDGTVRFVSGGVSYRVLAVEDLDPQRRFLLCLCEEEQA